MKYLFILAALLTGCAAPGKLMFNNPQVSNEQAQRDLLECRYEAHKIQAGAMNVIMGQIDAQEALIMCMQIRGYSK